ncbi:hypothetical protein K458DRAFT_175749 [Lentithecium fluviatile CBS 122367]|uniref:Uncharacterized protein n=1 Tax=Lentithecium fluviatile CBS 122367 TaxID=1168545 RepID=A0A6G1JD40_9PLEO|nr:hypothetical protein K458DRAFT_175749 [Lentithecium fluviatile CBS 122367]
MSSAETKSFSAIEALPTELHDEIVSHLRENNVIYEQNHLLYHTEQDYDHTLRVFKLDFRQRQSLDALISLRLTCKTLHRSATRALLGQCVIPLFSMRQASLQNMEELVSGEGILSSMTPALNHVLFDLEPDYCDYRHCFGDIRTEMDRSLFGTFERVFPLVLAKLPIIQTLIVSIWTRCEYSMSEEVAPSLDLAIIAAFRNCLVTALGNTTLEHLTDLRLTLPCAYDFVAVGAALPDDMCARLRRLYLGYVDATGPGGSEQYLVWRDSYGDGDEDVEFSNLQKLYPNEEYINALYSIVNRCPNLNSLGLSATQHLDGDPLSGIPAAVKGLKDLYLYRVRISHTGLIRLLSSTSSDTSDPPNPITSAWLEAVELKSGTWKDIFEHLLHCSSFSYLCPKDLVYARDELSHQHKLYNSRPWEDSGNIWTRHEPDQQSLRTLIRKLIDKAGGKEKYPGDKLVTDLWD